jgi:hypothetical protein
MTISFRSKNTATHNTDVTSITITKPAGTANNDLLLACIMGSNFANATISAPSGWTRLDSDIHTNADGDGGSTITFQLTAGPSEPGSYTFTLSSASRCAGIIACYTGITLFVDDNGVNTDGGSASSSTHIVAPALSPSQANDWLVNFYTIGCNVNSAPTVTPPGGQTARASATVAGNTGAFEDSCTIELADENWSSISGTGTRTATSNTVGGWAGYSILITEPTTDVTVHPTGVEGDTALGTPTIDFDFSFSWTTSFLATTQLGTVTEAGIDAEFDPTGLVGTTHLGTVAIGSSAVVAPAGVVGTGVVHYLTYEIGVPLVAGHAQPLFPMQGQVSGVVTMENDTSQSVTGVYATGLLNNVVVSTIQPILIAGVASVGHVGALSVQVDCDVFVDVTQGDIEGTTILGEIGHAGVQNITMATLTGLAATGQLGSPTASPEQNVIIHMLPMTLELGTLLWQNTYTVSGVQAVGAVGNIGFTLRDTTPSVSGSGVLGSIGLFIDSNVAVAGVLALGAVGQIHVESSTAMADSVVGYGHVGAVTFGITPRQPQIYTQAEERQWLPSINSTSSSGILVRR